MKLTGIVFALALVLGASTTMAQQALDQTANAVEASSESLGEDATSSTEAATSGSTEAAASGSTEAESSSLEAASTSSAGSSSGSAATATEAPVSSGSEAQATIMVLVPDYLAPSGSGSLVADAGWLDKLLHPDVGTGSTSNTTTAPVETSGASTASQAAGLVAMGLVTLAWTIMG